MVSATGSDVQASLLPSHVRKFITSFFLCNIPTKDYIELRVNVAKLNVVS